MRRDGVDLTPGQTCDTSTGNACRAGSCVNLCQQASAQLSIVGCEYWGVDLDNAVVSPSLIAAAQQYAVVVSNVQPDIPATVTAEQDDSMPGDADHQTSVVATAVIAAVSSRSSSWGRARWTGRRTGCLKHGTGTALTRHAFKVTSDFPIVAYQFNPLDNVNVFERRVRAPARLA